MISHNEHTLQGRKPLKPKKKNSKKKMKPITATEIDREYRYLYCCKECGSDHETAQSLKAHLYDTNHMNGKTMLQKARTYEQNYELGLYFDPLTTSKSFRNSFRRRNMRYVKTFEDFVFENSLTKGEVKEQMIHEEKYEENMLLGYKRKDLEKVWSMVPKSLEEKRGSFLDLVQNESLVQSIQEEVELEKNEILGAYARMLSLWPLRSDDTGKDIIDTLINATAFHKMKKKYGKNL